MKGLLKVICLFVVISLSALGLSAGVAQAVMPSVTYLETFGAGEQMAGPGAVDLDDNGNLYVADPDAGVVKFNKLGVVVGRYLAVPVSGAGLAVSADGGKIYVASDADGNYLNERVAILDGNSGALLGYLGGLGTAFVNAGEIDLDSNGFVYVLDDAAKAIYVFDAAGVAAGSFSVDVSGRLCALSAMAIDPVTNNVFVADKKSPGEVRVYSNTGSLLTTYAAASDFGFSMVSFRGIAFDGERRGYFVDNVSAKVAVLDFAGVVSGNKAPVLGSIDLSALVSGATMPQDVVVDNLNRLFVSGGYSDGPTVAVLGVGNYQIPAVNKAPGAPGIVSPMDGSVVTSVQPTLTFAAATDADGDALTYDVRVACAGTTVDSASGLASLSYQVQASLPENGQCSWSVKAFDGADASTEVSATFYVNGLAEAPSAPVLQAPVAQAVDVVGSSLFVWNDSVDPDPNDVVSYRLTLMDAAGNVLSDAPAVSGVALNQTAAYSSLVPGGSYSWSVTAVDASGLETVSPVQDFVFAESGLVIDSNVPGADVYIGGNPGYLGRKVGQTPYVQLGAAEGSYSVAVVHRGFEPVFGQVTVAHAGSAHFFADLMPALHADNRVADRDVQATYRNRTFKVRLAGRVMPWVADLDSDGQLDLVVGMRGDRLAFYSGMSTEVSGAVSFASAAVLARMHQRDIAPCVADWNNDDLQDLVYGARDGQVYLIVNQGTASEPVFDPAGAVALQAGGAPIAVGEFSAPVVADWNDDGRKDLLIGGQDGRVRLYVNVGSDAAPQLQADKDLYQGKHGKRVVPYVTDWNADGLMDLLVAQDRQVRLLLNGAAGLADTGTVVLSDGKGEPLKIQEESGLFVIDADQTGGKDVLIARKGGQLVVAAGNGSEPEAAFFDVLVQKLDQIADMVTNGSGDPTLLAMVDQAKGAAGSGDVNAVATSVSDLRNAQGLPADAALVCDELIGMMP